MSLVEILHILIGKGPCRAPARDLEISRQATAANVRAHRRLMQTIEQASRDHGVLEEIESALEPPKPPDGNTHGH